MAVFLGEHLNRFTEPTGPTTAAELTALAVTLPGWSSDAAERTSDAELAVARGAYDRLGYAQLAHRASQRAHGRALGETLAKLAIPVLPIVEVNAYKRRQKEKANRRSNSVVALGFFVIALGAILAVCVFPPLFGIGILAGPIFGVGLDLAPSRDWLRRRLPNYREPIPTRVLADAVKIAERLPNATFEVEWLGTPEKLGGDPFLVVSYGTQEYYVGVWDEPDFDA